MNYKEQLKSPLWQKKRLEILNRDKFICVNCKSEDKQLQVHHKKYIRGRMCWEYPNKYLVTLCCDCHKMVKVINFNKIENDTHLILFECDFKSLVMLGTKLIFRKITKNLQHWMVI